MCVCVSVCVHVYEWMCMSLRAGVSALSRSPWLVIWAEQTQSHSLFIPDSETETHSALTCGIDSPSVLVPPLNQCTSLAMATLPISAALAL